MSVDLNKDTHIYQVEKKQLGKFHLKKGDDEVEEKNIITLANYNKHTVCV